MPRFVFDHWDVNGQQSSAMPLVLTVTRDEIITAVYTAFPIHSLVVDSSIRTPFTLRVIGGQELSYVTPWSGSLEEGNYEVEMPWQVQMGLDLYQFSRWQDGDTNRIKTLALVSDVTLMATYDLVPPPPPTDGTLTVDTTPVKGDVFVDGTPWGIAPQSRSLAPGSYLVSFGDVTGYTKPSSSNRTVTSGVETVMLETYTPIAPLTGILTVETVPVSGEVFVGGQSWGMAPQSRTLDVGTYIVSFGQVQGYTKPGDVQADVLENQETLIQETYVEIPPPPPGMATLDIHAFYKGLEVVAQGRIVETSQTFTTPAVIEVTPGNYTLELTYGAETKTSPVTAVEGQITTVNVPIALPTPPFPVIPLGIGAAIAVGLGLIIFRPKK